MAGENARYVAWVRTQPCCACGTSLQIEPHHALYGTTYDPDGPRPAKAIEGARKGASQRSHDVFCVSLCIKCHKGIHELTGLFAGWSRGETNGWEEAHVRLLRNRYAMQCPEPVPTPAGAARRVSTKGPDTVKLSTVLEFMTRWAGERRLKDHEHQLVHDLQNDLKASLR